LGYIALRFFDEVVRRFLRDIQHRRFQRKRTAEV
jgi:hypothetical protein